MGDNAELPGTSKESLRGAAQQAAMVCAAMVKGGCPFSTAIEILKGRSPALRDWVLDLTISIAKEKLKDQGIGLNEGMEGDKQPVTESFDVEDVENGDLVSFGGEGKFYVVDEGYDLGYFWVTSNRADRFQTEAKGFPIYKRFAEKILERGADVKR